MKTKTIGFMGALLMVSHGAIGGPSVKIPGSWKSSSSGGGSSSASAPARNVVERVETPTRSRVTRTCTKSTYRGSEVSLNYLKAITQEVIFDDSVSIDENGNLIGSIQLNNYISACFIPAISTFKKGDKIFVKIENIYFDKDNREELQGEIKAIAEEDISIDKKYAKCLEAKNLIKIENGKKVLDIEKIKEKGLVSFATLPYLDDSSEKVEIPIRLDKNRSYQLYFASNRASGYGMPKEDRVGADAPKRWDVCMGYNQLSTEEEPFYKGNLELLKDDVVDICSGNDVNQKIKEMLNLRNTSFLGSFGVLSGAVDDILINVLEKEQKKIFEGKNSFSDIESQMRDLMVESRKNMEKGIVDKELGDRAKKLAQTYKTLLKELESKVHAPSKKIIEKLHGDYENATSDKDRERIEERLSGLSDIMGKFAEEGRKNESCGRQRACAFFKQFYIFEGQDRFKKDASNYEETRLSSLHWSKSSMGGRGSLSPSSVQLKMSVDKRRFASKTRSWESEAAVLEGSRRPIDYQQKKISKSYQKAQEIYREGPYKGLSWWCRSSNTQACARKRMRLEQRFQRRMQGIGRSIQRGESQLSRYGELAEQYQLRREYEREQYGWDDDGYDYFEDDYYMGDDYNFPGFGPENHQPQGPYDPSYYNNPSRYNMRLGAPMGGPAPSAPAPMGPGW